MTHKTSVSAQTSVSARTSARLLPILAALFLASVPPVFAQTGSAQTGSAQTGSAQTGSAQTGSAPAAGKPVTQAAPADPVVAKVDGNPIMLSDLVIAAQALGQEARGMPRQTLYPMLLDQLISGRALAKEARRTGLDQDPAVRRQLQAAEDQTLEQALLHKELDPRLTDAAVRARYEKDIAGKPGEEEVHARHILVADEAAAKKIIADLKKGGDFAALSSQFSTDTGAAAQGGDLGFFKKGDMVPAFAAVAFAMKDGEISPEPVKTEFGWHVIQTIERRRAPAPDFEHARDDLRQRMIQEGVRETVERARAGIKVETFNFDGTAPRATDMAEPPSAR